MTAIAPQSRLLAASVARGWLRLYTVGLPPETVSRRAFELESDLWEHEQDHLAGALPQAILGADVLGRVVRGMPADLAWRLQLEGPQVQLRIPFERILGGLMVCLVVLLMVANSISGYDTSRDAWPDEIRRLAQQSPAETRFNVTAQVIVGVLLVMAGVVSFLTLQSRFRVVAALAGFGFASFGLLTLVVSALYSGVSELADDYVVSGSAETLAISRGLAIVLHRLVNSAVIFAFISIYALAYAAWKAHLIPRWMNWAPALSVVLMVIGYGGALTGNEDATWLFYFGSLLALVLWLLVAGITLLLGRHSGPAVPPTAPPLAA